LKDPNIWIFEHLNRQITAGTQWQAVVRPLSTHVPIESSRKDEFVVFPANHAPNAVEKVIVDLRKLRRINIFLLQKGVRQNYC
jgi:hypothetical protein